MGVSPMLMRSPEVIALARERRTVLQGLLGELPGRELEIVRALFGIDVPPVSAKLLAGRFGISSTRIGKIRDGAFCRLRRKAEKYFGKDRFTSRSPGLSHTPISAEAFFAPIQTERRCPHNDSMWIHDGVRIPRCKTCGVWLGPCIEETP